FLSLVSTGDTGEGWRQLVVWLRATQSHGPEGDPQCSEEDLAELLDHRLRRRDVSADIRLLYLVRWLGPTVGPSFRGVSLTPPALRDRAVRAYGQAMTGERGEECELVEQLWKEDVLEMLAEPPASAAGPGHHGGDAAGSETSDPVGPAAVSVDDAGRQAFAA